MNFFEVIQIILNIVTIPVALVTVILLLRQTKQLDETLRSQVYQGLIDNSLKIDQLLIEHPEYRKFIYDYEEFPENDPDLDKLWGILDYVLDIVDNVKAQEKFIPKSWLPGWLAFTEAILNQPSIKYYLEKKYGFWYEGTLINQEVKTSKKKNANDYQNKNKVNFFSLIFRKKAISSRASSVNSNNLLRSYTSPNTVVKQSGITGFGTFAKTDIKKGEIVFVKGGHIVSRDKLFYSGIISSYLPISDNLYIGAITKAEEDGIKLYVNHSCEPNCGLRGEITFVAMRDILKGEELTFDYAMVDNEDYEFECKCGSKKCRKTVTGYDWKDKNLQRKYSGYFARYITEKIRMN